MPLKHFKHPHGVYHLEYPAHWDQIQREEGRSCGFGPHDRDDVGFWISILPMSGDTEKMAETLPEVAREILPYEGRNLRRDMSIRDYALKSDTGREGQAGHYWLIAGGDVMLFASSQVPEAEKDYWNTLIEQVLISLRITRDEELFMRRLSIEVLHLLRKEFPEQDFRLDAKGIMGHSQMVFMTNLHREVRASPSRRQEIIRDFVNGVGKSAHLDLGEETWEEARDYIYPMLKPKSYIDPETPTRHLVVSEWLDDPVICYAITKNNLMRFITDWDVERWEKDVQTLHKLAIENLGRLPWPERLEGSRAREGGSLILVMTDDNMASSRLLHPELHRMFSGPLGSPFRAGIPDRGTLVLFSDRRRLRRRTERRLLADYRRSAYPLTPKPFLVTPDGIAPALD